jgi:hypothetical protein
MPPRGGPRSGGSSRGRPDTQRSPVHDVPHEGSPRGVTGVLVMLLEDLGEPTVRNDRVRLQEEEVRVQFVYRLGHVRPPAARICIRRVMRFLGPFEDVHAHADAFLSDHQLVFGLEEESGCLPCLGVQDFEKGNLLRILDDFMNRLLWVASSSTVGRFLWGSRFCDQFAVCLCFPRTCLLSDFNR